jgi:hypothetical protein
MAPEDTGARLSRHDQERTMLDIVMLALGFGLFVLAIGYTYACERL